MAFIEKYIFPDGLQDFKAIGFKLFYYRLEKGNIYKIWDYILSQVDIRIVHLQRVNILKQLTSYRIAQKTQLWISNNHKTNLNNIRIYLDPNDCLFVFEKWSDYFYAYSQSLENHKVLHVTYEDLA